MKLTKKKVFVAALAISLVAIVSMGTLAWFTATDEVTNFFQVSTEDEQRPDFELELFEHEVLEDGSLGGKEVDTNTYTNVAPGDELAKDPTVRNAGQYDMWVRVRINLFEYEAWEEVLGEGFNFNDYFVKFDDAWVLDATTAGTDTLEFYYSKKLLPGESTMPVFGKFAIPEEFTVDNMPVKFKLNVVAEAIQADNTGDSAQEAFATYWSK